jgi:hypothetical protein
MRSALPADVRTLGLLASLLLIQCGPKQSGDDESSGSTVTAATDTTGDLTTTGSTSTGTGPTSTEPTTEPSTGGVCGGQTAGSVWTCQCETNLGPWMPFNEACDQQEVGAVEWAEWLCEEYADQEPTTGAGSTAGSDAGETATATAGETAADTDSLGCECTCRVTPDCCDDSLP